MKASVSEPEYAKDSFSVSFRSGENWFELLSTADRILTDNGYAIENVVVGGSGDYDLDTNVAMFSAFYKDLDDCRKNLDKDYDKAWKNLDGSWKSSLEYTYITVFYKKGELKLVTAWYTTGMVVLSEDLGSVKAEGFEEEFELLSGRLAKAYSEK